MRVHLFSAPPNCGDPGSVVSGQRFVSGTTPGSTVKYHCNRGYVLIGTDKRRCSSEGVWSDSIPTCNSELIDCSCPSTFQPLWLVQFHCFSGS